jgi:hypothetical protein
VTDPRLLALLRDASTITARYTLARRHTDECRAGWPTQTIGAAPDTTRSTNSDGGDGIPHDKADHAHRDMNRLLNEISGPIQQLANLVDTWTPERWWTQQHTTAEDELARIDDGLWCPNHLRHGHREVRDAANRRTLCRWCDGIKRDTGHAPDRDLIERHSRMTRITTADLDAFRARHGGRDRSSKKRKKSA